MSPDGDAHLSPVPTTVDEPGDWADIAGRLAPGPGDHPPVTLDAVVAFLASAVPLLFEFEASGDTGLLQGVFAGSVIDQCQRTRGAMAGERPVTTRVHLVGIPPHAVTPALRVHLAVAVRSPDGGAGTASMFWDLQPDAQVTVGRSTCPSCGAPLGQGWLVCDHCGVDVRDTVTAPFVVSRIEMY